MNTPQAPIVLDLDAKEIDHCAESLKSVAHPVRMAIVDLLGLKGPLTVTQIYESLSIEQAVASHHLGILKHRGLLSSERDGKNTRYALEKRELLTVLRCIRDCTLS